MSGELPPWPVTPQFGHSLRQKIEWLDGMSTAALARLREAKEWLTVLRHPPGCGVHWPRHFGSCDCGLDKFLADMLPEGEK